MYFNAINQGIMAGFQDAALSRQSLYKVITLTGPHGSISKIVRCVAAGEIFVDVPSEKAYANGYMKGYRERS